jgi:cytoskeletal protein CcmA (bactofilin family)
VGLFSSKNRGDKPSPDLNRDTLAPARPADAKEEPTPPGPRQPSSLRSPDASRGSPNTHESASGLADADRRETDTNKSSKKEKRMATMGQSIVFKGEMSGDEDLEIEGQVEGIVNLANHQLTIGANGRLRAEVHAKSIVVVGQVTGNLTATERIEIQATGVVQGDICAPRLNIQEGAVLNGSVDMSASGTGEAHKPGTPPATSTPSPTHSETLKSA